MNYTAEQIANVLDYAVLNPLASPKNVQNGAAFCNKHRIKSICVASVNVGIAVQYHCNVSSVIGFPHGNVDVKAKLCEAQRAILFGAMELDIVINFGRFLDGDFRIINRELEGIIDIAHSEGVLVKAILETCHYTPDMISRACEECVRTRVDYVKTSTGFSHGGATVEDVQVMLNVVEGSSVKVKASGDIKTYQDVVKYLNMGVARLETSQYQELLP